MPIPNDRECVSMLREAGCTRRVIVHCCTVRAVADRIVGALDADRDLVTAGALLHDIGRSVDHSITHAMAGASIAERLGLPPALVEIIRRHTGAGLDPTDVSELGLPPGDYIPRTLEEKVVAHADNLVSDNRIVPHTFAAERLRRKGSCRGADRIEALHRELSGLCGADLDMMVSELGEHPRLKGPCAPYGL